MATTWLQLAQAQTPLTECAVIMRCSKKTAIDELGQAHAVLRAGIGERLRAGLRRTSAEQCKLKSVVVKMPRHNGELHLLTVPETVVLSRDEYLQRAAIPETTMFVQRVQRLGIGE